MAVFLNGRFLTEGEARVSAFDAGLQHGVGVFETMRARLGGGEGGEGGAGRAGVFELEEHLARLAGSARELGLSDELRIHALAEAVGQTVERAGHARARVRVTVTGGDMNLLAGRHGGARPGGQAAAREHEGGETERRRDEETGGARAGVAKEGNGEARGAPQGAGPRAAARGADPTVLIVAQPATEYPAEMFERGVGVVIAGMRVNPLDPMAGHKTLNYWQRLRELRAAAAAGMGEALVFQVTNYLAGGCVSNAALVTGGRLVTPIARGEEEEAGGAPAPQAGEAGGTPAPQVREVRGMVVPSPVLPGITRAWLLAWARERGMAVERRMVSIDDVLGADELVLTNSGFGVLPVARVEKERIGAGAPGEFARAARDAWEREH